MDIEEYKLHKRECEKNLAIAIQREIDKFRDLTGYYPNNIGIELLNVNTIGQVNDQVVVGEVAMYVRL